MRNPVQIAIRRMACLTIATISFIHVTQAQCDFEWSLVKDAHLRNNNRPGNVRALPGAVFKVQYSKVKCGCGNPVIAVGASGVKNGYQATSVTLRIRGYDCNGKTYEANYFAHNVRDGQWDAGSGNATFMDGKNGFTVLRVEIEYFDPEFNATYRYLTDYENGLDETYINNKPYSQVVREKEGTKNEVNAAIKDYNQQYRQAEEALNKVKDKEKRKQIAKQLNDNHQLFDQYDKQAQADLTKGDVDGLKQTYNKIKAQQEELGSIKNSIGAAENTVTANNVSTNNPATNKGAANTGNNNVVKVTQPSMNTTASGSNNNGGVQQPTPQAGQVYGAISNTLTQFANAYGAAIDAKYNNWKVAFANANAAMDAVDDSSQFYNRQAHAETDPLTALQYQVRSLWFNCMSNYNNAAVNNTRYDFTRADITTGDYIAFKLSNNPSTEYNFLALDRYEMPGVLRIPICRLSDTKIERQEDYRKAFNYINDCRQCGSLAFAVGQNQWQSERIKCHNTGTYDEATAISLLQQNLYANKVESNIDQLDYATTRAWYNNLKLKNAKTLQDIIDMLQANQAYLATRVKTRNKLGTYEDLYASFADKIADYYLLCAIQVYCSTTGKVDGLGSITSTSIIGSYAFNNGSLLVGLRALLK